MDRHALALLIPILALSIPVVAIVMGSLVKLAKYRALGAGADPETSTRLDALEQEVGLLRQDLADAQDRLDFAERVLARPDNPPPKQLP